MSCLFAIRLIGSMDDQCRLVCLLSGLSVGRSNHLAGNHSNQLYKRSVLEFPVSGVRLIRVSVRPYSCGGAAWPMTESRWSSVGSVSSPGYTPPRLDEHSRDRSGNTLWGSDPLLIMGWYRDSLTPPGFSQHPWIKILDKCLVWGTDHEFLYFSVFFTVFSSCELSFSRGHVPHRPRD